MAKHPHRLILINKKTWRCTLPGCRYFIHVGLAHTLPGQVAYCWECSESFTLDERALQDDQPTCLNCRSRAAGMRSPDEIEDIINAKIALAKAGVKSVSELNPTQRSTMKMMGIKLPPVEDQIEVIEADEEHAMDCEIYVGNSCTCK